MKEDVFEKYGCSDITMYFDTVKKEFKDFTKEEEQALTYLGSANTFYPVLRRINFEGPTSTPPLSNFYNTFARKDSYFVNKYGICLQSSSEERFMGFYKKTPIKLQVPKCSLTIKYYEDKDDSNKTNIHLELSPETARVNTKKSFQTTGQFHKDLQLSCADYGNPDVVNRMFNYAERTYSKEAESIEAIKFLYSASEIGRFKLDDVDGDNFVPSMDYF